jgi:cysteinyl-tRNA synthetase
VNYWLHAEHLLVDHEKMSKSVGNFATLRELLREGHRPSSVRYLLASVPYRTQLNFTAESLKQAASSVERLRNFAARLTSEAFPAGSDPAMAGAIAGSAQRFEAALADDLNTAQALAAVFDMVREANIAMDRGAFRANQRAAARAVLDQFDAILAVLEDDDAERLAALGISTGEAAASDADIDALVAERQAARKRKDFKAADKIRQELADRGILLEDIKDGGIRWKRK